MITRDLRGLLERANPHLTACLEGAVGFTIARAHYEVTVEHLLLKLLEKGDGDLPPILRHFGIDPGRFEAALLEAIEELRGGNTTRPSFAPRLLETLEQAYLIGGVDLGQDSIRSGAVLAALLSRPDHHFAPYQELLSDISLEELTQGFRELVGDSEEDRAPTGRFGGRTPGATGPGESAHGSGEALALAQFTLDFTAAARAGEIDPVVGRDDEIRQMIDILTRRRKNNPILVGEAGVGKTALVEGLALRIAHGDVPRILQGVQIRSLDLGLLQAGAGVKGEFENRLKSVIAEIRESPTPIITFIDEAHTLIGAGGSAGQGDAANLLKPALARGELRTVAATTWSEYKKYFEKDAALARRFQLVKVDEPDVVRATVMMRGIKTKFEDAHGVRVLDSATLATVELSERYIAGRQLPDKSVDLLDTAAARVKIGLTSRPYALQDLERRIEHATVALTALERDQASGSPADTEQMARLEQEIAETRDARDALEARWLREKEAVEKVLRARGDHHLLDEEPPDEVDEETAASTEDSESRAEATEPDTDQAAEDEAGPVDLEQALAELAEVQGDDPLIPLEVTSDLVAAVVSDWTGIPVGKMMRDQARSVLDLDTNLGARVLGQDAAIEAVAKRLRASRAGLGNPDAPQGVFLLVGPSGIGKTETGLALADLLFGGERFMTVINMSEYMEAHTVSRLIGSPPGYVGYGEGGVLSEAVRQRPYSVVLLDEVEKAHPDVMNLFYQVFDKGMLADGEGREIDFKNTVLVMTSNLASDVLVEMCSADVEAEPDELVEAIRPSLREHFKPALLARMTIVPYLPLDPESLRRIVDLKLSSIVDRLRGNAYIELSYSEGLADWIAERCTVEETGARNIDHIIQAEVLPGVSTEILERMARDQPIRSIRLDIDAEEQLIHEIE